uniref:FTH domain-containing protein n=1 Tax=Panagrolaimus davidi TaxID=227884 RepID=A0A914PWF1_9BILA
MFSPTTKVISTEKLESEVTFSDIIEKVPNIEVFEIKDCTLKVNGETWIKDLMKFKNVKNFRKLCILLDTIEFDIELLKEFILTKCVHNVLIEISYQPSIPKTVFHSFVDKIGKIFFEKQYTSFRHEPHIKIYDGRSSSRYFILDIEKSAPTKATRKRKLE